MSDEAAQSSDEHDRDQALADRWNERSAEKMAGRSEQTMPSKRPGIEFPFIEGTYVQFRFADALAAAQRCSNDKSADPIQLIRKLGQLDLLAIEVGLEHGLKNLGDLRPVQRDFSGETWPLAEVSNVLIRALELLLFGTGKPAEERTIADKMAFVETHCIASSPFSRMVLPGQANKVVEEAETRKAEREGADDET